MIRRTPMVTTLAVVLALPLAACGGTTTTSAPALTDPAEIVRAALTATQSATSVHLDVAIDGTLTVALPIGGVSGPATPIDLTGATATADVDFADTAARATFAVPTLFGLGGEVIAVDGRAYVKTTLTGPLYTEQASSAAAVDPSAAGDAITAMGDLLLDGGVVLVKGDDIACGSKQCYTVSTDLSAADLGLASTPFAGMIDLAGATLHVTVRVEQDAPNHLAGATGVLTTADGNTVTVDMTASRWDEPVTVSPPPADQIKSTP
jgi:LppX_LprAFG lipoprotein